jgi:hypothetical protein
VLNQQNWPAINQAQAMSGAATVIDKHVPSCAQLCAPLHMTKPLPRQSTSLPECNDAVNGSLGAQLQTLLLQCGVVISGHYPHGAHLTNINPC